MATIIVHGTFSSRKDWWHHRSGDSFGGHLGASLEEAGYGNDVWAIGGRPVESFEALTSKTGFSAWKGRQAPPFDQNDGRFRWTGGDTHSDRLDAGLQLATYLATLASLSPNESVDIVAHSHGGNVVKEATQHVPDSVTIGNVVFLGCPHFTLADGSGMPYRVNPLVIQGSIANVYSSFDQVQVYLAEKMPDLGQTPGMPAIKFLGFAGTPMVNAARVDPDHALNGKYDQFEVPAATDHGRDVHSALTDPQVGYVAGRWFASDTESFEQSWYASGVAPIG